MAPMVRSLRFMRHPRPGKSGFTELPVRRMSASLSLGLVFARFQSTPSAPAAIPRAGTSWTSPSSTHAVSSNRDGLRWTRFERISKRRTIPARNRTTDLNILKRGWLLLLCHFIRQFLDYVARGGGIRKIWIDFQRFLIRRERPGLIAFLQLKLTHTVVKIRLLRIECNSGCHQRNRFVNKTVAD